MTPLDTSKEPFWVHCQSCGHEWILFYAPISVGAMAKFFDSPCPMCAEANHISIGVKPKAIHAAEGATATDLLMQWFASGDTGISSESLAFEFMGKERVRGINAPSDPADLGRCLRLIALVPDVRQCVDSLAQKHEGWAKAAKVWDAIAASMDEEVGIDWSKGRRALKTYGMMKEAGL